MDNPETRRRQINALLTSRASAAPGGALNRLLPPLRTQVASLVSDEGFSFLLERTIFKTVRAVGWLDIAAATPGRDRLDCLRSALAAHTHEEALEASAILLLNFVDLLASLIGNSLTEGILRSAWGDDALGALGEDE